MKEVKITPETILGSQPDIKEAMKEYAGIKIIEAVELLLKDFPSHQKEQIRANLDKAIDSVL